MEYADTGLLVSVFMTRRNEMSDINHYEEWEERIERYRQRYYELTAGDVDSLEAEIAADLLDQMEEIGDILKQPLYSSEKLWPDDNQEFQPFDYENSSHKKELVPAGETDSPHILPFPIKDDMIKE